MKTFQTFTIKSTLALLGLMMLSFSGFSKEHVTMSLKNIRTTSNTIEYDLYIVNDGTTALKLSACSYGVNFNEAILNGGTLTYTYNENTRGSSLNGLTAFSLATTKVGEFNQVRMTSTPSKFDIAPTLMPNEAFKVGCFKMTNSTTWTANSKPAFTLQEMKVGGLTATVMVGYIDNINKLTAMTPALKTVATLVEDSPILNPSQASSANTNTDGTNAQAAQQNSLIQNEGKIKIYPNPVTDILNAEFNSTNTSEVTINIIDMNGRLVKQVQTNVLEGLNKINIDLSAFAQGVYTIKMSDAKNINYTQTFTKQ